MKNTTQQPFIRKWTGPNDKSMKFGLNGLSPQVAVTTPQSQPAILLIFIVVVVHSVRWVEVFFICSAFMILFIMPTILFCNISVRKIGKACCFIKLLPCVCLFLCLISLPQAESVMSWSVFIIIASVL